MQCLIGQGANAPRNHRTLLISLNWKALRNIWDLWLYFNLSYGFLKIATPCIFEFFAFSPQTCLQLCIFLDSHIRKCYLDIDQSAKLTNNCYGTAPALARNMLERNQFQGTKKWQKPAFLGSHEKWQTLRPL